MIQGMLAVEARALTKPAALMARLNSALLARGLGVQYATLVYGVLSADGRFVYSNAGHNPPVVISQGQARRLTRGGLVVGAFKEAIFEEETLQLRDQDMVVMFSDGVTEARNMQDEDFGEARLMASLAQAQNDPAPDVVQSVLREVRQFCGEAPPADDITLTVTRFRAKR